MKWAFCLSVVVLYVIVNHIHYKHTHTHKGNEITIEMYTHKEHNGKTKMKLQKTNLNWWTKEMAYDEKSVEFFALLFLSHPHCSCGFPFVKKHTKNLYIKKEEHILSRPILCLWLKCIVSTRSFFLSPILLPLYAALELLFF